jgi:Concanavalin A-like lectin/glucanases superfamily
MIAPAPVSNSRICRAALIAACCATGCGRVGFSPLALKDQDAATDAVIADALHDAANVLVPDFVARYPMDDDPSITGMMRAEPSTFNITCDLSKCPVADLSGGWTLNFDRNGRIVLPVSSWVGGTNYSVSLWVKPNPGLVEASVLTKPLSPIGDGAIDVLTIDTVDPSLGVVLSSGGTVAPTLQFADGSATFGQWHHFVVTKQDQKIVVYIDGVEAKAFELITDSFNDSTATLGLGADIDNRDFSWKYYGGVDDLRFYSRAITAQEVTLLAANR